jgi:hypothetical protein
MALHVIIVRPALAGNGGRLGGKFTATLQGEARPLVLRSGTPFLDAARVLLERSGFAADDMIVMRWYDANGVDSLKARLRTAAGLTVQERNSSSPSLRFAKYAPMPAKIFAQPVGGSEESAPPPPRKKARQA